MSTINGTFTQIQTLLDEAIAAPTAAEKNRLLADLKKRLTVDKIYERLQAIETEPTYAIALPEKVDLRFTKQ
jgi:hypothetical protein